MKISVEWDTEEKKAIKITYQRHWTWDDFNAAYVQMLELLDSIDSRVDIIFDIRKSGFPPNGASSNFKRVAETNHPNAGRIIFVAPTMLIFFIKNILGIPTNVYWGTFTPPPFLFVATPEDARFIVAQMPPQETVIDQF